MSPRTSRPRSAQPSTTDGRRARAGSRPAAAAPLTLTCTSTAAPGRPAGDLAGQRQPVDGLPQVHDGRDLARTLLRCRPPDEVPAHGGAGVGRGVGLGRPAPGRSSRRGRRSPPRAAASHGVAPLPLVTATSADALGVAAGAPRSAPDAASRSRHARSAIAHGHRSSQATVAKRLGSPAGPVAEPAGVAGRAAGRVVERRSTPASASAARTAAGRSSAGVPQRRGGRGRRRRSRSTSVVEVRAAELVAPGPDARARVAAATGASPERRACASTRALDDAGDEPAPAGVDHADRPARPARTTGAQSAVRTASAQPGRRRDRGVGVRAGVLARAASTTTTSAPCTWRSQVHGVGDAAGARRVGPAASGRRRGRRRPGSSQANARRRAAPAT